MLENLTPRDVAGGLLDAPAYWLDQLCVKLGLGKPMDIPDYQLRGRWWFWLSHLLTGRPHLELKKDGGLYMRRTWVLPKNRWLNVYLHTFWGPDDPIQHDHPYDNVSLILQGGYMEQVLGPDIREDVALASDRVAHLPVQLIAREAGDFVFRRALSPHRIDALTAPVTRTLFLTGPAVRVWGFHTPDGWKSWRAHLGLE